MTFPGEPHENPGEINASPGTVPRLPISFGKWLPFSAELAEGSNASDRAHQHRRLPPSHASFEPWSERPRSNAAASGEKRDVCSEHQPGGHVSGAKEGVGSPAKKATTVS